LTNPVIWTALSELTPGRQSGEIQSMRPFPKRRPNTLDEVSAVPGGTSPVCGGRVSDLRLSQSLTNDVDPGVGGNDGAA